MENYKITTLHIDFREYMTNTDDTKRLLTKPDDLKRILTKDNETRRYKTNTNDANRNYQRTETMTRVELAKYFAKNLMMSINDV